MRLSQAIIKFCRDERGASAIEYAMIASLLSVAIMAALLGVNGGISALFEDVFAKAHAALTGAGDA